MPDSPQYPFDPTGTSPDSLVENELHTLTEINDITYRILIPTFSPFYLYNLEVVHVDSLGNETPLTEGVDYNPALPYMAASRGVGKFLYGGLAFINTYTNGVIKLKYQTLGGEWCADANYVYEQLVDYVYNPRTVWWDQLTNVQDLFPPIPHDEDAADFYGHEALLTALEGIRLAILNQNIAGQLGTVFAHLLNQNNPHQVHKGQIGLADVENLGLATDQECLDRVEANKYITLSQVVRYFSPTTP